MTVLQKFDQVEKNYFSADSEFGHLLTNALSHGLIGFTKVTKLDPMGALQGGVLFHGIKRPLQHLCNKYFTNKVGNVIAIAGSIGIATTCVWFMLSHGNNDFTFLESLKLNLSGCAGSELSHKVSALAISWLKEKYGKEEAEEIVDDVKDVEKAVKVAAKSSKVEQKSGKKKPLHEQTGLLAPVGMHQGSRVSYV